MRTLTKTKLLPLIALTLIVGAFFFAGTMTAYAAADTQTLSVDEVWLTGDTLHIAVTDKNGGESQTLQLNLSDYAKPGDEYVTVQATDKDGRTSNAIQFKNPYYVPQTADNPGGGDTSESAVPGGSKPADGSRPFTPDGTGTVMDNATDGDGKEFFTVETPDGNVFYLIVDRQRGTDNVYLLNAVTENDLASLAKPGDGKSVSAVETPPPTTTAPPDTTPEPTPTPAPEKSASDNTGTIIFVVIAVLAVGGAGYYFKILRPKQLGTGAGAGDYDEPEDGEDFDENEEMDVTDDGEEGEDE